MSGVVFAGLSPHPPIAVPEVGGADLEKISDTFITKYAKQIKHFDGAVDQFSGFEEELLKDSVSSLGKLKKAFW